MPRNEHDSGPKPNIADLPFAGIDVARHTWTVLAVFMVFVVGFAVVLSAAGSAYLSTTGFTYGLTITGLIGFSALLLVWIGAPLAWLLGVAMRRVTSLALHLAAFALLGTAAGVAVCLALLVNGPIAQESWGSVVVVSTISGACTAFGRYVAYRRRARTSASRPAPAVRMP